LAAFRWQRSEQNRLCGVVGRAAVNGSPHRSQGVRSVT
jgi:hypothetical protein